MFIAGLDVGSTNVKITVMNRNGEIAHYGYRDYPSNRNVEAHEINVVDIWEAAKILLKDAMAAVPQLSAVGITSFGESMAILDADGEVLFPAMMYTDPRGTEEVELLRERLGDDFICATAGTNAYPMYSLPKLMWIKKHRPDVYEKTQHICLISDYLIFKLTGERKIDYALAARTMGLDIRKKEWSPEIFEAAGICKSLFSQPVPAGTYAGRILPDVAAELGISNELKIVVSCHDQAAAAVGANVMRAGIATDGCGTLQCMTPVFSILPEGRTLQDNQYAIVPFLREDTYCTYAFSFVGGSLTKWFVSHFATAYEAEAAETNESIYQVLEQKMTDEPTGILVLPHFAGAGTPYMDTQSKGAFVGMTLHHTPADMFKAIMEGIAYEMRINMERLKNSGVQINELHATGGCAKSKLWLQLKADILGVPITRMSTDEAGTIGGIMLTGVATGVYADLDEAAKMLVQPLDTYYPRADMQAKYDKHYQRYSRLYDAIRPLAEDSEE